MIQVQRSCSPPRPGHTSPPVSPTVSHISSRSPTPSPTNRNGPSRTPDDASPERLRLPSPDRANKFKNSQKLSRSGTASEPLSFGNIGNGDPPKMPLLQDLSQYMNHNLMSPTSSQAPTSLQELAHLVRLSAYQERKQSQSRIRLHKSLVSTALSARLARCGELAHRTLVDNFRADQKKEFAVLYNAIHDVRNSCDATRRYSLLEPDLDIGQPKAQGESTSLSLSTFVQDIPSSSREIIFEFLSQIRTNPDFLASRISSLTTSELSSLSTFHQGMEAVESVLPFHTRLKNPGSSNHRVPTYIPTAVERLLSFQRHDPLSALIHTCFANSAGPDSNEDIRRTEVWATVCARLIAEGKSGTEPFICSVLNIWTAMRDWSGKSNLEWYLMKILEDGAFLLEKAEDQAGTRIHVEPRNAKDTIAADEFYDTAIKNLFEVVDDPGAGGIPEGLLELGNAILRKVTDAKRHSQTRVFLVSKWLFSVFLLNAIIHPECYGMMSEYHITEYARQKILKEVALRAQRLVVDLAWKQSVSIKPEIRAHIENIMCQFRSSRPSKPSAKLLPARSITSLRETAEVRPYLVISPSDLITLTNCLFPERRPASGNFDRGSRMSGLRSGASSISGVSALSMPVGLTPSGPNAFDTASVSGESIVSDLTSREPLLDDRSPGNRFSSASMTSMNQFQKDSYTEDFGYKLRAAIHEMSRSLGSDDALGTCHPCAEKWAVLFISPNGKSLCSQMLHDLEDDEEEETSSSDEDVGGDLHADLDKDYHQLRDSILKLVEDFEIPQNAGLKDRSQTFSNRPSTLHSPSKKTRSRISSRSHHTEMQSRNPYRMNDQTPPPNTIASQLERIAARHQGSDSQAEPNNPEDSQPVLIEMLEAAEKQCQTQSDFVNAHMYWRTLQQLRQISSSSLKDDGYASLLNIFSRGPRDSIRRSASAIEEYDAWLVWLKQSQARHDDIIESMMLRLRALRDKMWYVTDVRNSAAYEGARNIAVALKSMASAKYRRAMSPAGHRPRNMSRSGSNTIFMKTEAQVMDMMTASEEQGGPNKLSDEQAEKTTQWLSRFGIENFCKGEERIHRFCLETDTCINKLVSGNLMDSPVLWSSELYSRDRRVLDGGRQKGDLFLDGVGRLSISGEDGFDQGSLQPSFRSMDFTPKARPSHRDLRSLAARNESTTSFDSARWSMSRASTADIMDSQDYFGTASPVLTIDSATTFWSPFQTRSQSPSTSVSSFRPGTSSSTNDTVKNSDGINAAKQQFLVDLKQRLTSLLISDLGTLIFAKGSETDAWFSGDLGEECLDRKDRQERKAKKMTKKRKIEKKKSFRNLRSANTPQTSGLSQRTDSSTSTEKGSPVMTRRSTEQETPRAQQVSAAHTAEVLAGASRKVMNQSESVDFPYKASFQRLLRMFSVHPNPFTKLNALFELEHLIIASLTTQAPRKRSKTQTQRPVTPPSASNTFNNYSLENAQKTPQGGAEETIGHCQQRRSYSVSHSSPVSPTKIFESPRSPTSRNEPRIITPAAPSTDNIVQTLQDLFRSAHIRPKTLFRDLQFIASFVPAEILDTTPKGKAFWDAGLAALGLKQDVVRSMVEIADEIVQHYTQNRVTHTSTVANSTTLPSSTSTGDANADSADEEPQVMTWSMEDAARMYTITAKEGDPVGERELAIFYLTHPELLPERVTLPLSKPSVTFKQLVLDKYGAGGIGASVGGWVGGAGWGAVAGSKGEGREERDRERSDPGTMCVAYHWMEASAVGGDDLARTYLRQREELNAIP